MATILLTAIATAATAGASTGIIIAATAVAGIVGLTIDSMLFAPDIPDIEGAKIGATEAPTAEYGIPIPTVYGTARIPTIYLEADAPEIRPSDKFGEETFGTFAVMMTLGEILGVRRIWFNAEIVYDVTAEVSGVVRGQSKEFADQYLTFYTGTDTQTADPILNARHPGLSPGYVGRSYMVINELPLTEKYGNRAPRVDVEVVRIGSLDTNTGVITPIKEKAEDIVLDILAKSNIDTSILDLGGLTEISIPGYIDSSVSSARRKIDPLLSLYDVDAIDTSGEIKFRKRPFPLQQLDFSERNLIGPTNLVVNSYHDIFGRDEYFDPASGTSEGQFLMIQASIEAADELTSADPTAAAEYSARAVALGDAALDSMYKEAVPATPELWLPHWLHAADSNIELMGQKLSHKLTFTPDGFGGATANIPPGAPSYGELNRQVYSVRATDATLLWENVYSEVIGTEYTVTDVTVSGAGALITISTALAGDALIVFSFFKGPFIGPGTSYEAWPIWRPLDRGEVACAVDSLHWAVDAFPLLFADTSDSKWDDADNANDVTVPLVHDIDDGRRWIRPQPVRDAFSLGGSFMFSDRPSVTKASFERNSVTGIIAFNVPQDLQGVNSIDSTYNVTNPQIHGREVQFGRGITDTITVTDTSIRVTFRTTARLDNGVYAWVDTAPSFGVTTRYFAEIVNAVTATSTDITLDIALSSFTDIMNGGANDLDSVSKPFSIYNIGISNQIRAAHIFELKEIRALPIGDLPYSPGAGPFTANFNNGEIIDWRGPFYLGYQYPYTWHKLADNTNLEQQTDFMVAAQDDWENNVAPSPGERGPFTPVWYPKRYDSGEFGIPNTFGFAGPDPNTKWGGYQYRPIESAARAASLTAHAASKAKLVTMVTDFLTRIDTVWTSSANTIITDFTSAGLLEANYDEPHFAALIMRTAIWAELAGISTALTRPLVTRCWDYMERFWRTTGEMEGTWSPDPGNFTWFGFWHAECIKAMAMLLDEGNAIRIALSISSTDVENRLIRSNDFIKRTTVVPTLIGNDLLGVRTPDQEPLGPFINEISDPTEIVGELILDFPDPGLNYSSNTRQFRNIFSSGRKTALVKTNIPFAPSEALEIVTRKVVTADVWKDKYAVSVGPRFLAAEPGDAFVFDFDGDNINCTVEEMQYSFTQIPMKLQHQDLSIYEVRSFARDGVPWEAPPELANGTTDLIFIDIPILNTGQVVPGFWVAASSTNISWPGASLFVSSDGGVTYDNISSTVSQAVSGTVLSGALGSGPRHYLDETNTFNFRTNRPFSFESISFDRLRNGENLFLVGSELLLAQDIVLESDGTYTASNLLRGKKGTENFIGAHISSETVVYINGLSMYIPELLNSVGRQKTYKGVTLGDLLDNTTPVNFTLVGNSLKPFAPTQIKGSIDSSDNWDINWIRRDRLGRELPSSTDIPMSEEFERFYVRIKDSLGGVVKRTITVNGPFSTQPNLTYTSAQQVTDFGSNQTTIYVGITQFSTAVGEGTEEEVQLDG